MKSKTFFTIFIIGTILRIVWINVPPLWYDENFTLLLAGLPFDQMLKATMSDVHPPLWYFIEWLTQHGPQGLLDTPAWFIRIPALLCSIASLYLFRVLLENLHIPARVQVGAMVLMAIMPMQLWYAQEGRMYALLELEVMLALLFTMRFKWLPLFLVSVAMLYTQNYGMFYLGTIWLVSLFVQLEMAWWFRDVIPTRREFISSHLMPAVKAGCVMFAAFVMYIPWARVIAEQMTGIHDRYWIVAKGFGSILIIIYKLFMTAAVPNAFYFVSYFVTFGALTVGLWSFVTSKHPARLTVAMMAFVPILMASVVSWIYQPVLLFRALIGISPFLYIIAVWWLDRDDLKSVDLAFPAIVIVPVLAAALYGYYVNVSAMKGEGAVSSMSNALAYVESHWQDGDIIYATDDGPWVNLSPYTKQTIYRMPECSSPVLGSLSVKSRAAMGMTTLRLQDVPHRRAWIFAPFSPLHPSCYEQQVNGLIGKTLPSYEVDKSDWLYSAVWLIEQ